jgi:hypothetical protein
LTEQKLAGLREAVSKREGIIPELLSGHVSTSLSDAPDADSVNSAFECLARVKDAIEANGESERQGKQMVLQGLERIGAAASEASGELQGAFATFRESVYTPKVEALPPEDREILTRQIQVLEETKRLPVVEGECNELLREVKAFAKQLLDLCEAICALREEMAARRQGLVASINEELPTVRLQFLRSANRGRTAAVREPLRRRREDTSWIHARIW